MKVSEFIHFACTSEDINNLSHALMLKAARDGVMLPGLDKVIARLRELAHELADHAHAVRAPTASPPRPPRWARKWPTWCTAWSASSARIAAVEILGKINGAVGNYNAHLSAYPDVDWEELRQAISSKAWA